MTRPDVGEKEFRRLREQALRAAGRGPGPAQRQRPPDQGKPAQPADQGAPAAARPADPARKAPAPAASSAGPTIGANAPLKPRQPAKAEDQAPEPVDDAGRLDELLFGDRR